MCQLFHLSIQVVRLLYTNSGVGMLALGGNGIQKLWKWPRNEQNPSGKVIAGLKHVHLVFLPLYFVCFCLRFFFLGGDF